MRSPASFLVYNAGEHAKPGRVLKGAFKVNPGTPLVEYIHDTSELLEALGMTEISELPDIPCLERRTADAPLSPESIRAREARESRRARRLVKENAEENTKLQY